jgi:hypothetical protein
LTGQLFKKQAASHLAVLKRQELRKGRVLRVRDNAQSCATRRYALALQITLKSINLSGIKVFKADDALKGGHDRRSKLHFAGHY